LTFWRRHYNRWMIKTVRGLRDMAVITATLWYLRHQCRTIVKLELSSLHDAVQFWHYTRNRDIWPSGPEFIIAVLQYKCKTTQVALVYRFHEFMLTLSAWFVCFSLYFFLVPLCAILRRLKIWNIFKYIFVN